MPRLIDATPVEEYMRNKVKSMTGRSMNVLGWSTALAEIYNAKTVDAEPVTRCNDCQHWGPHLEEDDTMALCWAFGSQPVAVTPADGYCYRAKRRENDGTGQSGHPDPG